MRRCWSRRDPDLRVRFLAHYACSSRHNLYGVACIRIKQELADRAESEEELRGAIALPAGPEPEIVYERHMHSILELDDVEVGEVMTHMECDDARHSLPTEDPADRLRQSLHSLPLYRSDADDSGNSAASAAARFGARKAKLRTSILCPSRCNLVYPRDGPTGPAPAFRERREHFAGRRCGAFRGL